MYQPGSEERPFITIGINGERIPMTWENGTLYTHAEPDTQIDHIFITQGHNEEGKPVGYFLWHDSLDNWAEIASVMVDNDFTHVHRQRAVEGDREHYINYLMQDVVEIDLVGLPSDVDGIE